MNDFIARHKDLEKALCSDDYNTFKQIDSSGKLIEQWEKKDGVWVDVTAREKAKEELIAAQEELERERALEIKQSILSNRQGKTVPPYVHCPECGSYAIEYNMKSVRYDYVCEDCNKKFNYKEDAE